MKKSIAMLMMSGLLFCACDKKDEPVKAEPASDAAKVEAPAAEKKDLAQGFKEYKKASIVTEAKGNLKALATGAGAYFESEHPLDDAGLSFETSVFPAAETALRIGPEVGEATIGQKYTPSADMIDGAWKKLHFMPSGALYYTYYYISDGQKFAIKASASLEKACDSIWMVTGVNKDGKAVISDVIDVTGKEDCNGVKLP